MEGIKIIKGDTYSNRISITGVDRNYIDEVYLSCKRLGINKKIEFVDEAWLFVLSPEETANLKEISTTFDITIKFVGSSIYTGLYRGNVIVLDKYNEVQYE